MTTLDLPIPVSGYTAVRTADGSLVIKDVPIFVECERDEVKYNREWIDTAVAKAKRAEAEGYLPPLHIRHHEPSTEANDAVKPAGFFRVTGTALVTFKGSSRTAVLADLIVTDPAAQAAILQSRLPYRSVEIFDVTKPALDGLALLDHEAPFLELPMLMVRKIDGESAPVACATFAHPWSIQTGGDVDSFDAYFKRGRSAALLFRNEANMSDAPKSDDKDGDKKGAPDMKGIVSMIKDGSISVADFAEIQAAMAEMAAGAAGDKDDKKDEPAKAPTPSNQVMKAAGASEEFAALMGRNTALEARVNAMEADRQRDGDVALALTKLEGRPLGADLKGKLVSFHKEHGAKAFTAYVESMATTFAAMPQAREAQVDTGSSTADVNSVCMKWSKDGPKAVEAAVTFSREWKQLRDAGGMRMSEEAYIESNMKRRFQKLGA